MTGIKRYKLRFRIVKPGMESLSLSTDVGAMSLYSQAGIAFAKAKDPGTAKAFTTIRNALGVTLANPAGAARMLPPSDPETALPDEPDPPADAGVDDAEAETDDPWNEAFDLDNGPTPF